MQSLTEGVVIISKRNSSILRMMPLIISNEREAILMNAKQAAMLNSNKRKKDSNSALSTEPKYSFSCPHTTEDVYSIGIKLLYLIGDMYLDYANGSDKAIKSLLKELALKQLNKKTEIQKLADADLNNKLTYFYENGGPVMEPPVSEKRAKEVNGFFNRIVDNYLKNIEEQISKVNEDNAQKLEDNVNQIIVRMLTDLANLYFENEIRMAFKEMIYL